MITFLSIKWKNFLSTGNTFNEVSFTDSHTTLISGENGTGKSTILDALTYALFNKPYRNVNIPQLVNSVNERDCVVEVCFSDGKSEYRVVRGQSPKVFEIYKDGKFMDQEAKSKDGQRVLEEHILRMNYRSFCQVVILGSANYVPFMRLPAAERRGVVESILDINVFSTMNSVLKERQSHVKEELSEIETMLAVARERVKSQKKAIEDERARTEKDKAWEDAEINAATESMNLANKEMGELIGRIDTLLESIQDKAANSKKRTDFAGFKVSIEKKLASVKKDVEFYSKNSTCPTCRQNIDETFKTQVLNQRTEKEKELSDGLNKLLADLDEAEKRYKEISGVVQEIVSLQSMVGKKTHDVQSYSAYITKIQNRKIDTNKLRQEEAELEVRNREFESANKGKSELVMEQHYMNLAGILLRDGGIKKKIINHYIPIINRTINKFLGYMNFFVNFTLDEEFTETIKSRHRDVFTYASFSEGEKRKIDLSLLFAWRAMAEIKNSLATNLLILDEVLDGSLDDTSTEAFLEIVKGMRGAGVNVFVISHKSKEVLQDKFERHIQVVRKGNYSKLV